MRYKIKDSIVLPPHGPMIIKRIELKTVGGKSKEFYVMESVRSAMTFMVTLEDSRIRPLSSPTMAMSAMVIAQGTTSVKWDTWNKRYHKYMTEIESGDLITLATVFSKIRTMKSTGNLSFGERKMLDLAGSLIATEVALVFDKSVDLVLEELNRT